MYNLKSVKNTLGGMLILVKLQAAACKFTKINTPPWVFFTFLKLYSTTYISNKDIRDFFMDVILECSLLTLGWNFSSLLNCQAWCISDIKLAVCFYRECFSIYGIYFCSKLTIKIFKSFYC